MTWKAPAPEAAFPPTEVADATSVSGVTSVGWVQPEALDWVGGGAAAGCGAAGADVTTGAALPDVDELPAQAIAKRATTRLIGANRRTIILPSRLRYPIVARTALQHYLMPSALEGPLDEVLGARTDFPTQDR